MTQGDIRGTDGDKQKDSEGLREGQAKEMKETTRDEETQGDVRRTDGDKQKRQRETKGGTRRHKGT